MLDCGSPEHQDVDAGISLAIVPQGAGDAPDGVLGVPGFDPRADALFEGGDDLVGDACVCGDCDAFSARVTRSFRKMTS